MQVRGGTSHLHGLGSAGTSSASELPLWGSENPGIVLVERTISVNQHRGSKNNNLLLIHPRNRVRGGGLVAQWARGRAALSPSSSVGRTERAG